MSPKRRSIVVMTVIAGVVVGVLFIGWAIVTGVEVSRLNHTCAICRQYRLDTTCFGMTRSTYSDTECSRWYAAEVEPVHAHVWQSSTCCYSSDLFGGARSVGCSPGRFTMMLLSPDTQLEVYQHFKDPLEAKKLFVSLADPKISEDRLDGDFRDRGHLTVDALQQWEAAGFPGTWDEWWTQFYAKHAEEHKEWLVWMNADSNMNFWDWRKQKKESR